MLKSSVEFIHCEDKKEASKKALEILLKDADQNTLLLLSGGTSPDLLYRLIAENKTLKPGAVVLIDERFGSPMHETSNEKMIFDTGLVEYLKKEGISFYGILKKNDMENIAEQYEQTIRNLFKKFSKKIAIMGIGTDGHTAGIKPLLDYDHTRLVVSYDDINGPFGKRVTLTFEALAQIDEFIILVFGDNEQSKKEVLRKMFQDDDQKLLPAVFYTNVPSKVIILTVIVDKIHSFKYI